MDRRFSSVVVGMLVASLGAEAIDPHDWPPHPHLPESGVAQVTRIDGPGTVSYSSNTRTAGTAIPDFS